MKSIILFIVFVAVVGLSYIVWMQQQAISQLEKQDKNEPTASSTQILIPLASSVATTRQVIDTSQLGTIEQLQTEVTTLSVRITGVEKKIGQKLPRPALSTAPNVKEVTIYLGTGTTTNRDWTDIPAAVASLNTNNYSRIKAIYFEAGLSIIGGEAHARLVNESTGQVYFDSEVFGNSSNSTWQVSSALNLPSGMNQYEVQLKSTSGEAASLDGSRIHIYLQ